MQFFLDGSDIEKIKKFSDLGLIDGVTTNPSIILKSGKNMIEVISELASIVSGSISAEVSALDSEKMVEEGIKLSQIAENVTVKLPITWDGLEACNSLSQKGISVNMTLCFSASQALLAAKSGAEYVSPFIGRLDDLNLDGADLISDIKLIYSNYNFSTKVLAASIRTINHVKQCALLGADVATIPIDIFEKLVKHPLTDSGLSQFTADWEKTGQSIL
ncbi:MAG: fructose-6-phosphate aldolase [Rhodobacteraceae bacterium]|jgi:transaldolase|nr:fructose-6-phosphate aldolase [Paracoccaceae bacterium]MEC7195188.1 fructose-6-phosphate aldolase [Pseudomonadota bacterium]|tara:strand:- start:2220 stop:2873 length:654 start_codon:yes stop_codon:yes gene_type:complete